jgi:hypothetical protein
MSWDRTKLEETFGTSENGNFMVVDTIGVPHPYCIDAKHVVHASDHFAGMLGEAAIESAEKHGIYCATCKGQLKYKEHEQALLVECWQDLKGADGKVNPELAAYLVACKPKAEEHKFTGFAFIPAEKKGA